MDKPAQCSLVGLIKERGGGGCLCGGKGAVENAYSKGHLGEHYFETLTVESYSRCLKDVSAVGMWHKETNAEGHLGKVLGRQ